MVLQKILDNIKEGKYNNTKPFPNKDVTGDVRAKMVTEHIQEQTKVYNLFVTDINTIVTTEYGFNESQIKVLFDRAWDEGHSEGLEQVVYELQEILDLIQEFNEAK